MKWIKTFYLKMLSYVSGRAAQDIATAVELTRLALPIVQRVAALTPTRSDNELVRLFQEYAVPGVHAWLQLPREQRGRALMQVAATQLKRVAPDTVDRIIDLAVQAAVVESRAAQ